MNSLPFTGGCYCSHVRYEVSVHFLSQCYCHCHSCRLASGAPVVAWGTITAQDFRVTSGEMKLCTTKQGVTRGFCSICGTGMTYANDNRPTELDISLATIDEEFELTLQYHLWVSEKLPWFDINDGLPQYQEWRSNA